MEQTECSEMSAYKIQTPGNYPEESLTTFRTRQKFEFKSQSVAGPVHTKLVVLSQYIHTL